MQLKGITNSDQGAGPPAAGGFGGVGAKPPAFGRCFVIFWKKRYFNAIELHFASVQQSMVRNGTEDDFSMFHTGNFLPFHTKNLPFHIPFHTKIFFHTIPYFRTKKILDQKQCNAYFAALLLCNGVSNCS